jgi:hypothetical protein
MRATFLLLTLLTASSAILHAEPAAEAKPLAAKAIAAAGGETKLLRVFRMKERFNFGAELADPAKASTRESIVEAPQYWWLKGKDRDGEPAKFDVWAWTLVALTDTKTVMETIPGVEENGKTTLALRLTGTIEPAMDLHFDPDTHRLIRFDWANDIYRFSEWHEHDGAGYHAKTVMHKRKSNEPWLFHEILEIERLTAAPADLPR